MLCTLHLSHDSGTLISLYPTMSNCAVILVRMAKEYQHLSHSFEPVFDERSRILVLGSFPSVLSRKNDFYYGNPSNRFWRLIADIVKAGEPTTIAEKKALLLGHGIALWDVIQECDIKGSSDASIKNVEPVEIRRIFDAAPVERVICNGACAGRLYKKYLHYLTGIDATVLPSTSPANASWNFDRLCERWGAELEGVHPATDAEIEAHRETGRFEYHTVRLDAPTASSYAVHKSMQGNKRKDTKPELIVRAALRDAGLTGYRLQWKVPGRPDIAWPGKRVAIFVNGCFWHRCPHCSPSVPKKNIEYWETKFAKNVERDERNLAALKEAGWTTHVIWECELKKGKRDATLNRLVPLLHQELGK